MPERVDAADAGERYDRRDAWKLPPRPEWLARLNALGELADIRSIVPLDERSLLDAAKRNTGKNDFGDDIWIEHFRVLLRAIEEEAKLNFFGRILTRSDLLVYLEARLEITDCYARHPEIEREVIDAPIFIVGLGRSGTTILQETLAHDPQFRTVQRWEGLFPCPPPEAATYANDPRIARAQALAELVFQASPEWKAMHAWGGNVPIEDIEFTYPAFFSEVWPLSLQIPSYEKYFHSKDPAYHFFWHQRTLKLLQWKYKAKHWLLKNPTHLPRIPHLLRTYPDARLVFAHRDPITSNDSVVNVQGTIYAWRTDDPFGGGVVDDWLLADERAKIWDDVIGWLEDGTIRPGSSAHVRYADFARDPMGAVARVYADLDLELTPVACSRMQAFLATRPEGAMGRAHRYERSGEEDPAVQRERRKYARYQSYFAVPDER
jgi:hypothetical protein